MSLPSAIPDFVDTSVSLYQVLGVNSDATDHEIKQQYQKLSRIYHPDRHAGSETNQRYATEKFPLIEFAKRILMTGVYRKMYDENGYGGLDALLRLGDSPTTNELTREASKYLKTKNASIFGSVQVPVHLKKEGHSEPLIEYIVVNNGIQKFVTENILLKASVGSVMQKRSIGNIFGELGATWFHGAQFFSISALFGRLSSLRASYQSPLGNTSSSIRLDGELTSSGSLLTVGYIVPVSKTLSCHFSLDSERNFVPQIIYQNSEKKISAHLSPYNVSFKKKKLTTNGYLKNIGIALSADSAGVDVGLFRKSKARSSSFQWDSRWSFGSDPLKYQIRFQLRAYQIIIPLYFPFLTPAMYTVGMVLPHFLFVTGSVLYDVFYRDAKELLGSFFQTDCGSEEQCERIKETEKQINMMRESVEQIVAKERECGGIIIIEAWYGNLTSPHSEEKPTRIDVTIPLQFMVHDSRLKLGFTSKKNLEGFCDPCLGQKKQLWVRYQFHGDATHTFLVNDTESISAPKPKHAKGPKRPF